MPKHIHAELMAQYAQDAMETDKPWELWEVLTLCGWSSMRCSPSWEESGKYRRKPKTFMCNGFELEYDRFVPEENEEYFAVDFFSNDIFQRYIWEGVDWDNMALKRNIVHRTKEGAIAHAKAMLGIDPKGEE